MLDERGGWISGWGEQLVGERVGGGVVVEVAV